MKPLVLLAVALVVACTPDTNQRAHPRPKQSLPMPVLAPQDRDFIERAAKGSNAEIVMGTLVDARATRPDVIAFGHAMVKDHTEINRRLGAIVTRYRIVLPTDLGDHQASYDRVVDLRRDEFDREFSQVMIEDHDMAVQLFREAAAGAADPALRAFAAQTLPLIQAHLRHAKALEPPPDTPPELAAPTPPPGSGQLASPDTAARPPSPPAARPSPSPEPPTPRPR